MSMSQVMLALIVNFAETKDLDKSVGIPEHGSYKL